MRGVRSCVDIFLKAPTHKLSIGPRGQAIFKLAWTSTGTAVPRTNPRFRSERKGRGNHGNISGRPQRTDG